MPTHANGQTLHLNIRRFRHFQRVRPVPGKHIAAYNELEKMVGEGKLKSIGLSNYTIEDYNELKPHITVKPTVNQVEINPFVFRKNTIQFFQSEGVVMYVFAL